MRTIIACTLSLLALFTSAAMAESINGRLGLTGKLGFVVPLNDSEIKGSPFGLGDIDFAGGGGLIYGFGHCFAAELDIAHIPALDVVKSTTKIDEAEFTDISLGLQLRIMPNHRLVPYIGAGIDFIKGDISDSTLDWTLGGHVNGGIDFFLNKSIALVLDCKAVFAEKSDIQQMDVTVGKFDPTSVITTFGVRLFLPEKW